MVQSACKLTLVYPIAVEDRIVELLMESDPPVRGFTTWAAEGHGHDFAQASLQERVRGRVARGVLVAVMMRDRAERLLSEIEQKAPLNHLAFWLEPILGFGRMTPQEQEASAVEPVSSQASCATKIAAEEEQI